VRGLVTVVGASLAETEAADTKPAEEDAPPPPPAEPGEVVFSSPTDGETDVPADGRVRVQFSRGVDPVSLTDRIRVSYLGTAPGGDPLPVEFTHTYDAATRAVEIRFTRPPGTFRTVRVELVEGIRTFDGAPVRPWALTFTVGAN
jgi:hypothetical protein